MIRDVLILKINTLKNEYSILKNIGISQKVVKSYCTYEIFDQILIHIAAIKTITQGSLLVVTKLAKFSSIVNV
jgi:hypothetical protein